MPFWPRRVLYILKSYLGLKHTGSCPRIPRSVHLLPLQAASSHRICCSCFWELIRKMLSQSPKRYLKARPTLPSRFHISLRHPAELDFRS